MKLTRDNSTDLDSDYKTAGVKKFRSYNNNSIKKMVAIFNCWSYSCHCWYLLCKYKKIAYQSKLTFALDQAQGESGLMSFAAQFGLNLSNNNDVFAGDNIIEILQSRRIVEQSLLSLGYF